jgi:hypothetical protein
MAGKRHSAGDMQMLAELSRLSKRICDLCESLGYEDEENEHSDGTEPSFESSEEKAVALEAPEEEAPVADESVKAMSLDDRVSAIRDAFWRKYDAPEYAMPGVDRCWIVAVYDDYVIVKRGLVNFKVPFTMGDKVVFTDSDQWQRVEAEWVMKNAPIWLSQVDEAQTVKALGSNRLGMYLVLWGDPKSADVTGEYFTPETKGLLNVYNEIGKVPLLYHHGMDDAVKAEVIGHYDVMVPDEVGIWAEAQVTAANQYVSVIKQMAKKGYLGSSSGTLPAARKVNKTTGEIEGWTIVEGSLTPTPADWRQRTDTPVQVIKSYYSELGLTWPETDNESAEGDEESRKARELDLERERLALLELEIAAL